MGGFNATSNVLAGNLFGTPLCGTHSHAYVSSYMVMRSGIPNFCAVVRALHDLGYKASGVRLDSGNLAYLSIEARKVFRAIEEEFNIPDFGKMIITASNDLNEETIDALNKQGHEVDAFGIGTYLVTCYSRAALGCVFKLVEINSRPRIKLSEDVAKVSIPCKKRCFRLYGKEGYPLVDIMIRESEPSPKERDVSEESGCKLVHGDVFRPPRSLMFLSALVGIGTQLAALILLVIVLAIVGMLYNERGAIITTFIVFYALTSFISGYVSGGLYSRNGVVGEM